MSTERRKRHPVGVLPYRLPPLSGLYFMRYHPPAAAQESSSSDTSCHHDSDGETGAASASTIENNTSGGVSRAGDGQRHQELHTQLLATDSLDSGTVDLFALYSLCEATPVPCAHCSLHMDTTLLTCSYRLRETYKLTSPPPSPAAAVPTSSASSPLVAQLQQGWYAFFFPLSECGRLKDNVLVCVGDALVAGDVAECDFDKGGVLRPLAASSASAAANGSAPSPPMRPPPAGRAATPAAAEVRARGSSGAANRVKPLFYYVVSPLPVHAATGTAESRTPTDVSITVSWRSYPATQTAPLTTKRQTFTLLYSYYCAPRAPDVLTCRAQFRSDAKLRLVRSPNADGAVTLVSDVAEHSAKLRVETADGAPLEAHRDPKDYTFQVIFYFGDYAGILEETSWFAATAVAAVFLLFLWFFLTKDLVL